MPHLNPRSEPQSYPRCEPYFAKTSGVPVPPSFMLARFVLPPRVSTARVDGCGTYVPMASASLP